LTCAATAVLVTGAKSTTSPLSFAPLGLVYILAMFSSNLSLQYIDYPSQVLGKSCKPLAVLLVGALVWRTVFPKVKYISVALITLGITLFMFQKVSGGHGAGGGAHGEDSNALLIGRLLIFGSLLCDGATGSLQDALVGKSRPSAYHLMFWNNAWAAVFLGVALLYTGRFQTGYQFALAYPEVLELILAFSITSAAGQMFIYYTVRHHGSLVCTMVTTTRKFFTILLSVVWFGHRLTDMQWLAVLIVFLGLAIDAFYSSKSKKKHD
jgi:solute carrier family 35 (UDP-galactose transporter), member B1